MKKIQRKVPSIWLIICLIGFPQISESIFTPVLPELSESMHISASMAQLTMSSYFITFAFGVLFWGFYSDKVGRRQAIIQGIVVYLLGNIGLLFAPTFGWLIAFRLIQAFGASTGSVITQTIVRESFEGKKASRVFATIGAAMSLSPALGPLIGGIAQTYFGYKSVFSILIILAVMMILYSGLRLPETIDRSKIVKVSLITVIKRMIVDKNVWMYAILVSGCDGILFSYYAEAPFIFINHFGLSSIQYGMLGMVIAISNILAAIAVNYLIEKFNAQQVAMQGIIISIIGGILFIISAYMQNMVLMSFLIFVIFFGVNITIPMATQLALLGYEDIIGAASGLFSFEYYILISLFTYLISVFHNGQLIVLPIYFLVISLIMYIALKFVKK